MDILKNKTQNSYDYKSRYLGLPYYYNTLDDREEYGIGYNMDLDINWVAHKVSPDDNLDSLALNYYNNPTYWWIIAYFNNIQDSFIRLIDHYDTLKIPSLGAVTFKELR